MAIPFLQGSMGQNARINEILLFQQQSYNISVSIFNKWTFYRQNNYCANNYNYNGDDDDDDDGDDQSST